MENLLKNICMQVELSYICDWISPNSFAVTLSWILNMKKMCKSLKKLNENIHFRTIIGYFKCCKYSAIIH